MLMCWQSAPAAAVVIVGQSAAVTAAQQFGQTIFQLLREIHIVFKLAEAVAGAAPLAVIHAGQEW